MIILSICSILLLLCIVKPKSKLTFVTLLGLMWIIMTFITGNADESVYLSRYKNASEWTLNTELLFQLLNTICNKVGFSFVQYKGVLALIILTLIGTTIWKFSKFPNIVLLFYFICPFPLNVSQLRFALASAIFIWSYRYLLDEENKTIKLFGRNFSFNSIKYVLSIVLASLIHSVAIIWLMLYLVKKLNLKQTIVVTILANIYIYFFFKPSYINWLLIKLGAYSRMSSYFSVAYQNSEYRHYSLTTITLIFIVGIFIICCLLCDKRNKSIETNQIEMLLKFNISSLSMLAFIIRFTSEMYRPQEALMVLNYIILTNQYRNKKILISKGQKNEVMFKSLLFFVVVVAFIMKIVLFNYDTVLKPMFF